MLSQVLFHATFKPAFLLYYKTDTTREAFKGDPKIIVLPLRNIFLVCLSEQFQFVSQRHRGFPFSITLYSNGIMVARLSSCCEYRYAPGFQQGRKSCFRLVWLAGGIPCYRLDSSFHTTCLPERGNNVFKTHDTDTPHMFRCTSFRNKYSSCQQLTATNERLILPLEQNPANNTKPESEYQLFTFQSLSITFCFFT